MEILRKCGITNIPLVNKIKGKKNMIKNKKIKQLLPREMGKVHPAIELVREPKELAQPTGMGKNCTLT